MFSAIDFSEFRYLAVHEVLACHIERARKVVYFLILLQSFINDFLNGAYGPEKCPAAVIVLIRLVADFNITEAVVFKRVPDYLNVAVVQEKVVATVLRHVRPNRYGIFIWTKDQEILLYLAAEFSHDRPLNWLYLLILLKVCLNHLLLWA